MTLHKDHKVQAVKTHKSGKNNYKVPPHGEVIVKSPAVTFTPGNTDK